MKAMITFLIVILFIGLGGVDIYAAQPTDQVGNPTTQQSVLIITPFPITLNLDKEPKDTRGTDVTNIYNLTVSFADPKYSSENLYTIMYFVDNLPLEEFKGQRLPFILKRNYKGLVEGNHQIKVDVEDGKGNVLATNTTTVHVHHDKQN